MDLGAPFHLGASLSVEAWVWLDANAASAFAPIAARWDGSFELDVNLGSGKANFVTRNDGTEPALAESTGVFTRGEWHHVAGVFDGGISTLYVDGEQGAVVDTSRTGSNLQDAGSTLFIGSTRDGGTFLWRGLIDEVAFYDHALTANQIRNHIDAAGGGCKEDLDRVSIGGQLTGAVGRPVTLQASFQGIDPGAMAVFEWTLVSGAVSVFRPTGATIDLICSEPGDVVVRVEVGDGKCSDLAWVEAVVECVELERGLFYRGDADANGQIQLTDAIRLLGCLFVVGGFGCAGCDDAADADDNGAVQLTDSIRILNYLFLGNTVLPAPGPPGEECGIDPTADALGCQFYPGC